jgi:hypothetical protein
MKEWPGRKAWSSHVSLAVFLNATAYVYEVCNSFVRKSCGPRYAVFAHIWVHAVYIRVHVVYMRVHAVYVWDHAVNMQIHAVNMQVHAVYNVIIEYFFIILYLKIIKNYKNSHVQWPSACIKKSTFKKLKTIQGTNVFKSGEMEET